jgi:hypothetical protein
MYAVDGKADSPQSRRRKSVQKEVLRAWQYLLNGAWRPDAHEHGQQLQVGADIGIRREAAREAEGPVAGPCAVCACTDHTSGMAQPLVSFSRSPQGAHLYWRTLLQAPAHTAMQSQRSCAGL